jgi:hypothetical protein
LAPIDILISGDQLGCAPRGELRMLEPAEAREHVL